MFKDNVSLSSGCWGHRRELYRLHGLLVGFQELQASRALLTILLTAQYKNQPKEGSGKLLCTLSPHQMFSLRLALIRNFTNQYVTQTMPIHRANALNSCQINFHIWKQLLQTNYSGV